jgi:hypothetical protein
MRLQCFRLKPGTPERTRGGQPPSRRLAFLPINDRDVRDQAADEGVGRTEPGRPSLQRLPTHGRWRGQSDLGPHRSRGMVLRPAGTCCCSRSPLTGSADRRLATADYERRNGVTASSLRADEQPRSPVEDGRANSSRPNRTSEPAESCRPSERGQTPLGELRVGRPGLRSAVPSGAGRHRTGPPRSPPG